MTDRQALLAAIRAHPDEDTPRLAFADFLDESGDAFFALWARLIRAQIETANAERFSPRWLELVGEQKRLFAARPKEWTPNWNTRLGPLAIRRGFREAADLDPYTFPKSFDTAFGSNPIRALSMNLARARKVAALADHPGLAFVETLDLAENGHATTPRFLRAAAEGMPRLRALGLARMELSVSQVDDILAIRGMQNVTALDLSGNPLFQSVTHGRPETLFHGPVMDRLRWLDLADTAPSVAALEALSTSPRSKHLTHLDLSASSLVSEPFGFYGARALAQGGALRGVRYLDLSGQRIGTAGLRELLAPPLLRADLRELILTNNGIDDDGVRVLAATPLPNLRRLELGRNVLSDAARDELLNSSYLVNLTVLDGAPTTPGLEPVGGDVYVVGSEALFAPCP